MRARLVRVGNEFRAEIFGVAVVADSSSAVMFPISGAYSLQSRKNENKTID